jgi:hypothetical protein
MKNHGTNGLTGEAVLAALEAAGKTFGYPADAAVVFEKDIKTIYLAMERGEIPHTRIGQRYHIPVAWMRRQVDGHVSPQPARRAGVA